VCNRLADRNYSRRRVLVADDQAVTVQVVEELIRAQLGCHVKTASDGDEVLRLLEAEPYDVLVTDMLMPGVHGLSLVSTVREKWPDMDIIVMTGFPEDFPYVEVVHAGANDFISKPHPPEELEAKLIRIFKERDTRDAQILAEIKYRSLFELSMEGMVLLDPDSHNIVDMNDAFCELTGREKDDLMGMPLSDVLHSSEKDRLEQGLALFAVGGQGTLGDVVMVGPDGKERSIDVSATFIDSPAGKVVFLAFKDVTEKREIERQLAEVAQTDQLTGLSNKHTFHTHLECAVDRARSEKLPMTLITLDLDNFKQCNDTYGHLVGDEVLTMAGELIRQNIRVGGDEGFRYGGDEFAVLLMGAPSSIAKRIADRMLSQYEQAENYGTSLSIGIAEYRGERHAIDFIRVADDALYKAKALGKNGIHIAS